MTDLFGRLFFLQPQMVGGVMTACEAASVYVRPAGGFPKLPHVESAKKWQRTFFYMKNANQAVDRISYLSLSMPHRLQG